MTEDEAKQKWCPYARVINAQGDAGYNRVFAPEGSGKCTLAIASRCAGSNCMAWRWRHDQPVGEYRQENGGKPERRIGYCGLAGRP